ncbi:MAG: XDD3 family exosortase-dependent surface protein [Cyanobacteriota bacterium]|nr:XDD3 family exosortase-dependent surface protein [Cyanobacteriota bacterium]
MFNLTPQKILALSSGFCLSFAIVQPVQAATFKALNKNVISNVFAECINDGTVSVLDDDNAAWQQWHYSHDSTTDGVDGLQVGGNVYEIFGMALKETKDSILVAINGNMPLTGQDGTAANDGNIGWGDFFLNFSGKDFTTASNDKDLFAVRFAGENDSFVPSVGLYGDVSAVSTTGINSGFASISDYNQRVTDYGGFPSFGDLPANTNYFDQSQSLNNIGSGQYLADIMYLTLADLQAMGYDSSQFGGQYTHAFKIDKSAICQSGVCETVPEPSTALALVAVGLGLGGLRLRRRKVGPREG